MQTNISTNSVENIQESISNSSGNFVSQKPETDESSQFFTNDSIIGRPRNNKVEIKCYRTSKSERVCIKFYSRTGDNWNLKQSLEFEKDGGPDCDPKYTDFNNDRLNDISFISGSVARGINEIRTLLIYDEKQDELVHIKNSEEYPNLEYNPRLNCITAWRVYGGNATDFLRLKGNVLEEFASVENFSPNRTVTVINRKGMKKIIRQDKIAFEDQFKRYINFKPLE